MSIRQLAIYLTAISVFTVANPAHAAQSQDFGDYIVHYNAITTEMLPPSVASAYSIQRSSNVVLLNITVLKEVMGTPGTPVNAEVEASAVNLTNQHHNVTMREIEEKNAIYYIGTLGVDNRETYQFTVMVTPEGMQQPFVVRFRQQFFTE